MKGPHITREEIEGYLAADYSLGLGAALRALGVPDEEVHPALDGMTLAALVFQNGFIVTGTSSVITSADYDPKAGQAFARENAIEAAWPLFGWALREKLIAAQRDVAPGLVIDAEPPQPPAEPTGDTPDD